MPEGFESAYAYARTCGSLARSYLGERTSALAASHRVGEAWRAIFCEAPPALPEAQLAAAAERRIRARSFEALRGIAGPLLRSEPFLIALARKWEFGYLKNVLATIVEGSGEVPLLENPRLEPGFDMKSYPALGPMLRGTNYAWIIESGLERLPAVKNRLDRQYYEELWRSASDLPTVLKGSIPELLRAEVELENLIWALRLKRYYSMAAVEIEGLLIILAGVDVQSPALRAVGLRADSRSEWVGWKWEALIPDSRREDGGDWFFDIRGFETAVRRYLFRKLFRCLHLDQDSFTPLYCYFSIKEFESKALCGIIEGINLEAPAAEIGAFAVETTGGRA